MLNGLWAFMMIAGIIYGSFNGNIQAVTEAAFQSAGEAVSLCITMLGIMSFWTGILKIGELRVQLRPHTVQRQRMDALAGHAAVLRFCGGKQQGSLALNIEGSAMLYF